jgi:hypothetical protein
MRAALENKRNFDVGAKVGLAPTATPSRRGFGTATLPLALCCGTLIFRPGRATLRRSPTATSPERNGVCISQTCPIARPPPISRSQPSRRRNRTHPRCGAKNADPDTLNAEPEKASGKTILATCGNLRSGPIRFLAGVALMVKNSNPKRVALWRDRVRRRPPECRCFHPAIG